MNVPRKATIIISYIGYKNQIIVIGKEKNLRIIMEEDTEVLDEVVVVGYGTTSKRKTTAAVATVNAENLTKVPSANITQTLAGQVPGVIVASSGGGIGKTSTISIRGGSTPLVVIDDVISEYRDFENLNPEDIEQMTILKDASATAVYGARAADGILLIVTKQGKAGKMSVNYNGTFSFYPIGRTARKIGFLYGSILCKPEILETMAKPFLILMKSWRNTVQVPILTIIPIRTGWIWRSAILLRNKSIHCLSAVVVRN